MTCSEQSNIYFMDVSAVLNSNPAGLSVCEPLQVDIDNRHFRDADNKCPIASLHILPLVLDFALLDP